MGRKGKWSVGALLAALLVWLGIGTAGAAPSAPVTGAALVVAATDSLIVSWSAPANSGSAVDGYRVTIRSNGQIATTPASVGAGITRFAWAIAGVQPGQTVTLAVSVEAHNAKGYGEAGTASVSYTATDLVPGAPTVQLQVKPVP